MSSFLRWLGGSGSILPHLMEYFPNIDKCKGYIEPFVGGGHTFFYIKTNYDLDNKPIYLNDLNTDLMKTYSVVRDENRLQDLLELLRKHEIYNNKEYYYMLRDKFHITEWSLVEKAAAFIYLTHASIGGMWRVNKNGKMNASYCGNLSLNTIDRDLRNGHYAHWLNGVKLSATSFENILNIKNIEEFFVFIDPPFYSINGEDNFTGYTKDNFHLSKRILLPRVFKELDDRGCKVMMRNSNSSATFQNFKDYNINIIPTNRKSGISWSRSKKEERKYMESLSEVLVTNYDIPKRQQSIMEAWS